MGYLAEVDVHLNTQVRFPARVLKHPRDASNSGVKTPTSFRKELAPLKEVVATDAEIRGRWRSLNAEQRSAVSSIWREGVPVEQRTVSDMRRVLAVIRDQSGEAASKELETLRMESPMPRAGYQSTSWMDTKVIGERILEEEFVPDMTEMNPSTTMEYAEWRALRRRAQKEFMQGRRVFDEVLQGKTEQLALIGWFTNTYARLIQEELGIVSKLTPPDELQAAERRVSEMAVNFASLVVMADRTLRLRPDVQAALVALRDVTVSAVRQKASEVGFELEYIPDLDKPGWLKLKTKTPLEKKADEAFAIDEANRKTVEQSKRKSGKGEFKHRESYRERKMADNSTGY